VPEIGLQEAAQQVIGSTRRVTVAFDELAIAI
jgi:hypothetical protein